MTVAIDGVDTTNPRDIPDMYGSKWLSMKNTARERLGH